MTSALRNGVISTFLIALLFSSVSHPYEMAENPLLRNPAIKIQYLVVTKNENSANKPSHFVMKNTHASDKSHALNSVKYTYKNKVFLKNPYKKQPTPEKNSHDSKEIEERYDRESSRDIEISRLENSRHHEKIN